MNAVIISEQCLGGGSVEIAVRFAATRELVAVITHPCPGAKWFLYRAGRAFAPREKYRSRTAALTRAADLAETLAGVAS